MAVSRPNCRPVRSLKRLPRTGSVYVSILWLPMLKSPPAIIAALSSTQPVVPDTELKLYRMVHAVFSDPAAHGAGVAVPMHFGSRQAPGTGLGTAPHPAYLRAVGYTLGRLPCRVSHASCSAHQQATAPEWIEPGMPAVPDPAGFACPADAAVRTRQRADPPHSSRHPWQAVDYLNRKRREVHGNRRYTAVPLLYRRSNRQSTATW